MVVSGRRDTKLRQGDQGGAVTDVQAEVKGLEPGLDQWDGEEGGWEKRDSLRTDRSSPGIQAEMIMQPQGGGF